VGAARPAAAALGCRRDADHAARDRRLEPCPEGRIRVLARQPRQQVRHLELDRLLGVVDGALLHGRILLAVLGRRIRHGAARVAEVIGPHQPAERVAAQHASNASHRLSRDHRSMVTPTIDHRLWVSRSPSCDGVIRRKPDHATPRSAMSTDTSTASKGARKSRMLTSVVRQADRALFASAALARVTLARMSPAFAVQMKGLGSKLCSAM
jgi:hypothetical protein